MLRTRECQGQTVLLRKKGRAKRFMESALPALSIFFPPRDRGTLFQLLTTADARAITPRLQIDSQTQMNRKTGSVPLDSDSPMPLEKEAVQWSAVTL